MSSAPMRAEALALLCASLAACAGDDLILGDGRAADSGSVDLVDSALPPPISDLEPPRVIAELESDDVSDDDPSLTADLLLLCFNSKRDAGMGEEDIWCSRRGRSDEAWGAPEPQAALNTEHRETGIALSLDGLSLWFSSDRDGDAGGLDVFVTTRATRDGAWSTPARVTELSSADDDLVSSLDESGLRMLLSRRTRTSSSGDNADDDDDDDADDYDIFLAERPALTAAWQAPGAVSELNTDAGESDGFWVGAGLQLIFTREADLMLAQRASLDAPFDRIEPLSVLNSDQRERDAWSNGAFDYVVFSSDRAGSFRLYESRRR
jgi:hypothetical protein